jgi:hypothetical protein
MILPSPASDMCVFLVFVFPHTYRERITIPHCLHLFFTEALLSLFCFDFIRKGGLRIKMHRRGCLFNEYQCYPSF